MRATTFLSLVLATASTVLGKSCHRGGVYCGVSLLNRGNYHDHIVHVLTNAKIPTDDDHIQHSLFDCLDGGNIQFRSFCGNGCANTDNVDADHCI